MAAERERAFLEGRSEFLIENGVKFIFNPETKEFILGSGKTYTRFDELEDPQIAEMIKTGGGEQNGIILNNAGIITTPNFRRGLINVSNNPHQLEYLRIMTSLAMESVFEKYSPPMNDVDEEVRKFLADYKAKHPGADLSAFEVEIDNISGTFSLRVPGHRVDMGPDQYPHGFTTRAPFYSTEMSIDLPVGYFLHNVSDNRERSSLLAGAGTIAWVLNQAENPQIQ